jgi:hypothetical protein
VRRVDCGLDVELPSTTSVGGLRVSVSNLTGGVLGIRVEASGPSPGLATASAPHRLLAALHSERFAHWFITLVGTFDEAALDALVSWFPRRVAVGKVAVVCERGPRMQGVVLAAAITVPLVPRPVRVFSEDSARHAQGWISGESELLPVPVASAGVRSSATA